MEKSTSLLLLTVLLVSLVTFLPIQMVESDPAIWFVPDDFLTIQEAVDNASSGDTIYVRNGTYTENVFINKTISLIGENLTTEIYNGSITVENTSDVVIKSFKIRIGGGIFLNYTENSLITDNLIRGGLYGVFLLHSINNTISNNNITRSGWDGILLGSSSYNTLRNNNLSDNSQFGLQMSGASFNIISGNEFSHNAFDGIFMGFSSNNNEVFNNYFTGNRNGLNIQPSNSYNTIFENNFIENHQGAYVHESPFNRFFHNNFIDSGGEFHVNGYLSETYWDNGTMEGNYWSDYTSVDWSKGAYQNETGSDGIGDTPYHCWSTNEDRYPLMKRFPWGPHDLAVTRITSPSSIVGQGLELHVTVTLFNYGSASESFNATAYFNSTIFDGTLSGVLTSKNCTLVLFNLNTTDFAYGTILELSAMVDAVPGELDTEDNVLVNGWVLITIPGDVDGNGEVSIFDIVSIAGSYGSTVGDPEYDASCDLDGDGDVDIFDIVIAAGNYGEQYTL